MSVFFKGLRPLAVLMPILLTIGNARANDIGDIAARLELPAPVVESVFTNIDAFFQATPAPSNQLASGLVKDVTLRAVKSHYSNLEDTAPGKNTDAQSEEKNALYKAQVRTIRHETSEVGECVESMTAVTVSEGLPIVRNGSFTFNMEHPKVTTTSWKMIFCRTPINGGSDFTDWQLK